MGPSGLQLLLVLLAIVIAFAWRDLQEAMSLEELKSTSERRSAAAYPPLARLGAAAPDGAVWIAPIKDVNAFVAGGREVFVTAGLEALYVSGALRTEHMAAIIAHEIGHQECDHYRRRRRRQDVETVAGVVVTRFGLLGRLASSQAASLTRAKLSRDDEFEADARAAVILRNCGLSPVDLIDALAAFERLDRAEAATKPGTAKLSALKPSWLASHPPIPERIRRLRAL